MGLAESQDILKGTPVIPSMDKDLQFHVLRGREQILRMHPVLVELSARCGQTGAMDHIALFLESPMNRKKTPYLVLATTQAGADPDILRSEEIEGAALVYEYDLLGWPTRVFITDDGSGSRTVIAPREHRSTVTIKVCAHLMRGGARSALLSYKEEVDPHPQETAIRQIVSLTGSFWGSQVREMSTYLNLESTLNATLANLGKHTRRNLRYYRRRTEAELGCSFAPEVVSLASRADFEELGRNSTHPIRDRDMQRRYDDLAKIPDSFCVGMRSGDGRWLSLIGGRRHHGWTEVDWQVNRAGFDRLSLGTAMRCYFLEHEVSLRTKRLYFEGGTPHTMRHSLRTEKAVDIIALRPSKLLKIFGALTRTLGRQNFLLQTVTNPRIHWQLL